MTERCDWCDAPAPIWAGRRWFCEACAAWQLMVSAVPAIVVAAEPIR